MTFVDGVFQEDSSASKDDRFDADAAIATGEIRKLIPDFLEALGGEMTIGIAAPEADVAPATESALANPAADNAPF